MTKVLIVEDDEVIASGMAQHLSGAGFDPVTVGRGEIGLARLRYEAPDVVVLDLMLPGLDGWEVLRRIKGDALTAAIPVLVLTASADLPFTEQALLLGATSFLTKPIDSRVLVEHVDAVVGQTAGQEEHA